MKTTCELPTCRAKAEIEIVGKPGPKYLPPTPTRFSVCRPCGHRLIEQGYEPADGDPLELVAAFD